MIVVVIVCLLAVIGLAVGLWRFQHHIDALTAERDDLLAALDAADNEVTEALTATTMAEKERDDALERVHRARRDAAEVAGRLHDETTARETAEARVAALVDEIAAAAAQAADDVASIDADRLWELAVAEVERRWRMSVATGPDEASPFSSSDDELRTAVRIEVDAAREDAGAAIELEWQVDDDVTTSDALVVLATVRELIAAVAKTASSATLSVTGSDGAVDVLLEAVDDDDAPLTIDLAGAASPGRYRVGTTSPVS